MRFGGESPYAILYDVLRRRLLRLPLGGRKVETIASSITQLMRPDVTSTSTRKIFIVRVITRVHGQLYVNSRKIIKITLTSPTPLRSLELRGMRLYELKPQLTLTIYNLLTNKYSELSFGNNGEPSSMRIVDFKVNESSRTLYVVRIDGSFTSYAVKEGVMEAVRKIDLFSGGIKILNF